MHHIQNLDNFPFELKVQLGQIPGTEIFNRFAQALVNVVPKTIWSINDEYVFQTIPKEFYISSSEAADNTQTIMMRVIDSDYNEKFAQVALNGQNAVLVPGGPYIRGNCMRNISPGDDVTAGDVYMGTEIAPALGIPSLPNTVMHMPQNEQRCATTVFTVPVNQTAFVFGADGSVNKGVEGFFEFVSRPFDKTRVHDLASGLFENVIFTKQPYWRHESKSDLWLLGSSVSIAPGDDVQAGYFILLIDNNYVRTIEHEILT